MTAGTGAPGAEPSNGRRVEVVHESLLTKWPRLVRWRAQDVEGAQLRDELRQAAQLWEQHDRAEELLWSGPTYREFLVWRDRYPGGLTTLEEAFAVAMSSLANRRRRRRRIVLSTVFAALIAVLASVGTLWRRSARETLRAEAEAQRAEAAKLVALGQLDLASNPSSAVAHAIASLELSDSREARMLTVQALWKGPLAFMVSEEPSLHAEFAADGRLLVHDSKDLSSVGGTRERLRVVDRSGRARAIDSRPGIVSFRLSRSGDTICSWDSGDDSSPARTALWSTVGARLVALREYEEPEVPLLGSCSADRAVSRVRSSTGTWIDALGREGRSHRLGPWPRHAVVEPHSGSWLVAPDDGELVLMDLGAVALGEPHRLGSIDAEIDRVAVDPLGRFVAALDAGGSVSVWDPSGLLPSAPLAGSNGGADLIRFVGGDGRFEACAIEPRRLEDGSQPAELATCSLWSLEPGEPRIVRTLSLGAVGTGDWCWNPVRPEAAKAGPDLAVRLWPTGAPAAAEPLELLRGKTGTLWFPSFSPDGAWLATPSNTGLALWPLGRRYPAVLRRHAEVLYGLAFSPDGDWLASASVDGTVRLWPLGGEVPASERLVHEAGTLLLRLAVSPDGRTLLTSANDPPRLIPLEGGEPLLLTGFGIWRGEGANCGGSMCQTWGVAFSPDGRMAAASGGGWNQKQKEIRVWNVKDGEAVTVLGPDPELDEQNLEFLDQNHVLAGSESGLKSWDLRGGKAEIVYAGVASKWALSPDRRWAVVVDQADSEMTTGGTPVLIDLETSETKRLSSHGDQARVVAVSTRGEFVVSGDGDGTVRVGSASGDEPHLLLGHDQSVEALAIDPLGRWIASTGEDTTIRLWPMPDLSQPPLHTLPRDELVARLRSLTNARVIRDPEAATGWTLTHDSFPGWETVPTW